MERKNSRGSRYDSSVRGDSRYEVQRSRYARTDRPKTPGRYEEGERNRYREDGYKAQSRTSYRREPYGSDREAYYGEDGYGAQRDMRTGRNTGSARQGKRQAASVRGGSRSSSTVNKRAGSGRVAPAGQRMRSNTKRRGRGKRIALFLLLFAVLAAACTFGAFYLLRRQPSASPVSVSVDLTSLDSPYAELIDADSGKVLGSKKGDDIIYPASMTKIMTVLTAIDQIKDLDATVTMSYDYYDALYAQDASRAGFEPGEEAVIRDLLYGAMLPSGAECCMELAIQAAGSEEAFVAKMNEKVKALGLTQTNFTNCTGLHNDNQYSTPHEIGRILQAAAKNKTFYKVFTTPSYTVGATAIHPEGFTFQSTMFKNMSSPTVIGGEILGGKTGYTSEAGHCLASMAEVEGRKYIQVTAGWAENPRVDQYHINDAFLGYNALGRAIAEAKEQ